MNLIVQNSRTFIHRISVVASFCLVSSCSKDRVFNNPYDAAYDPALWKVNGFTISILPSHKQSVKWGDPTRKIDGFVLTRTVDRVPASVTVDASARSYDFDPLPAGKCSVVTYSIRAKAGENLSDPLTSVEYKLPVTSTAKAGPGLSSAIIDQKDYTLNATPPTAGETGLWTIIDGIGGSFSSATSPTAVFSGVRCNKYILRWTITGPCSSTSQDINVDFKRLFLEFASAGPDVTVYGTSTTIKGNTPPPGDTGHWVVISGAGGSFLDASSATTTFTGQVGVTYSLRWIISDGCSSISSEKIVKMLPPPTIDGVTYRLVTIGNQVWFAENLRTSIYANGDPIANVTSGLAWSTSTSGAWVDYNNDPVFDTNFGKLYNGYAVTDSRGLCPSGTHAATASDWSTLTTFLGGSVATGPAIKVIFAWSNDTSATNATGFSAYPAGYRDETGVFGGINTTTMWWLSTGVVRVEMQSNVAPANFGSDTRAGLSVRCVYN